MKKNIAPLLPLAAALILPCAVSQAHTVALGWEVLPNGDVTFYNAHWHGFHTTTQNTGLFIDGVEYKFDGIENNVNSRTGLTDAIFNPSHYAFDSSTGTLTATAGNYNDWFTVTVSGLQPGAHTFSTTPVALTYWHIPQTDGSVNVVLPPAPTVPEPSSFLALGLLGALGLSARRRAK